MDEKEFNRLLKNLRVKDAYFRRFYTFYLPKIIFYITENYRDADLAQDVAHEFFQSLLGKAILPKYVKYPTLWVMRKCDDIARQMREERGADECVSLEYASETIESMPQLDPTYTDTLALLDVLDELSERIVVMRVCEGYDLKEIAVKLDISYDVVRQRFSRGIRQMRDADRARSGK